MAAEVLCDKDKEMDLNSGPTPSEKVRQMAHRQIQKT